MSSTSILESEKVPDHEAKPESFDVPDTVTIGSVIRHFRNQAEMSQADVSKAMGYRTPEWLGMIEADVRLLDIEKAAKLAQILDIDIKDFVTFVLVKQYPTTARVLCPERANAEMPSGAKNQALELRPESIEHALLFESLADEHRKLIHDMTKALMSSRMNGKIYHRNRDA